MISSSSQHQAVEQKIADRIKQLCDVRLATNEYYLVSQLGADLGEELNELKRVSGTRLSSFIQRFFSNEYKILRGGQHGNVEYLVPINTEALPTIAVRIGSGRTLSNRYHRRFWAAFAVPLSHDVRYLNLDTLYFQDADASDPVPTGIVTVDREYIPPKDAPGRVKLIEENIQKWLEVKNLERARFLVNQQPPLSSISEKSQIVGRNLLDILIESLDIRQRQRFVLPLDVVATLMRKQL